MRTGDLLRFTLRSIRAEPQRTGLTALGVAVGIGAVVLLTSIGEGAYRFVLSEFTQFGTRLISVQPGKTSTLGVSGAVFGTVRPLTLDDAEALARLPHVVATVPVVQGNAEVEGGGRRRRTTVYGVGPEVPEVWRFGVTSGRFLPRESDASAARPVAVLGAKLRQELFADASPLGERLRLGGDRYRVIGVVEPKGQLLGFDLDDAVHVPAARALELFDREGLMEIHVLHDEESEPSAVVASIERVLLSRHGKVDFTVVTQQQMLDVLGSVLRVLTLAIAGLGAISLVVGGVGILTMMTISTTERTAEIGLLRALGARRAEVLAVFLLEATLIGALGGAAGLALGAGLPLLLKLLVSALPVHVSWSYALGAELLAMGIGLLAGVLPAYRAVKLDPVEALRSE